ncbi:MAG: EscU/YscU/HrcU family type III secretion system export apparatus switch protein [Pseudomonadota bacterium]
MAESGQDKSEAATPYKLKEAQKRGQVAKSTEANFAAVLAALVCVCFALGPSMAKRELAIVQNVFYDAARSDWASDHVARWLMHIIGTSLEVLAPLMLAICGVVIMANLAQVGAIFSFDPIKPDFTKLNPATGLKRLFSMRVLYDALRSVIKLGVLTGVVWVAMKHLMPELLNLSYVDPRAHAAIVLGHVAPLLFKLLLVFFLIGLIDVIYTRWDYAKKMRMSHRDITDEHKQKEGDPRIRHRMRQLRNELLQQARSVRKLPEADVLITNPTHIAVAISYRHGEMPAPKLLAKGSGKLAAKMREAARLHHIPIVENPLLARELFKRAESDEFVPEDLYPKVAKILIWVYAMRNARNHPSPQRPTSPLKSMPLALGQAL